MTYTEPAQLGAETTEAIETAPQQLEAEATPSEGVTEGAPSDFYTVTIDGQEQQVTLDEALAGYQRQADYTRKTQELAATRQQIAEAERLWQALQHDPENTLRVLSDAYGLDASEAEELDPEERRWREVESFMQVQREQAMQTQIDGQLTQLHTQFGDFDDNALIQHMVDHSIGDFEAGYAHLMFTQQRAAEQQRQQADAQTQQRKATAPPIAGGHGVQGGAVVGQAPGRAETVAEAYQRAKQQHNFT